MNPLLGVGLKIGSTLFFTLMAALIKLVADRYPVGEIAFSRCLFGLIPVLLLAAVRGQIPAVFHTQNMTGHLVRASVGTTSMFMGFAALGYLPLADATAIGYAAPLFTVVFAFLFLGEAVRLYRWSAVAIGLVGVLVIVSQYVAEGGPERSLPGVALQVGSAIFAAAATIQISRLARTERAGTIVVYFSIFGAAIGLCTLPFGWRAPDLADAIILVATGLLGGIGQVLLTQSYRHADASVLAPFDYMSMIWAILLSFLVFSTVPTPVILLGSAIVVAAGLFVVFRERQLGLARAKIPKIQPTSPTAG